MRYPVHREDDRQALLSRVGNLDQLCGIRRCVYDEGPAEGLKFYDVHNAQGLEYSLTENRCLDVFKMRYQGVNIPFMAKPGLVGQAYADPTVPNFKRSIGGGLFYTCGFSNVGAPYTDDRACHAFNGRARFLPAERASSQVEWEDGTYKLRVQGEIRDAGLFGDNLLLRRTVSTELYGKYIDIRDEVENQSFLPQEFMLFYHICLGYPLIDAGARVLMPEREALTGDEAVRRDWDKITAPAADTPEQGIFFRVKHDADGFVHAGVWNEKMELGLELSYDARVLPYLCIWRCMISGDYVYGFNPANNMARGKPAEQAAGNVPPFEPFGKRTAGFRATVIDGPEELAGFEKRVAACNID